MSTLQELQNQIDEITCKTFKNANWQDLYNNCQMTLFDKFSRKLRNLAFDESLKYKQLYISNDEFMSVFYFEFGRVYVNVYNDCGRLSATVYSTVTDIEHKAFEASYNKDNQCLDYNEFINLRRLNANLLEQLKKANKKLAALNGTNIKNSLSSLLQQIEDSDKD